MGPVFAPHVQGICAEALGRRAVPTMLANSMMPEAFEQGRRPVGLYRVLECLVAAALILAQ